MLDNTTALNTDIEVTGRLATALETADTQGVASFRLLLSMLQQDLLQRPVIEKQNDDERVNTSEVKSFYPPIALAAQPHHWQQSIHLNQYINNQQQICARLYDSMFPAPIAMTNNAQKISDEVKANCDYFAQQRLAGTALDNVVKVDEKGLYEILNSLHNVAA